jgi:hypothetical protein
LKENLSMADAALPFSKQHVQIVCVGRSKIRQRKLTISDLQNRTPAQPAPQNLPRPHPKLFRVKPMRAREEFQI